MAFDAQVEDWQRMGMRLARTLDAGDPFGSVRAAVSFGHRYASDRDSLPQTNSERAFRLVAQATELIDYELPFAEPARADRIIAEARGMLEQARTLDPHCHDAARMIAAQDRPSFDEFYHYLTEGDAAVRADCERARDAVNLPDPEACRLARDLAFLPYLRWLANESSRALICGRYRRAIEHATELARLDENGIADADLTLAIAHTKLEDQTALNELSAKGGGPMGNAWLALATLAMAYKRRDMSAATQATSQIIAKWPHAALTLELQDELPDGVFSRIVVEPGSEDELILAVSEFSIVLQEGRDSNERGSLGGWLASLPMVRTQAELDAQAELREGRGGRAAARGNGRPGRGDSDAAGNDGPTDGGER